MPFRSNTRYPHPLYAWLVVSILLLANICSFVDRMILTLLVEPIKGDLGLSDTQIGVLHGFAFAAFYALMGLPIGRLADYMSRRNLIVIGITLWTGMTALCGLARNFVMLFLARMGTGIGEATLNPTAFPLVADYFPKDKRSKPIGLLAVGPYFGGGLSFLIGSFALVWVTEGGAASVPLIGALKPWQQTFLIVSSPGVVIAMMVLLVVREPSRHDRLQDNAGNRALLPWKDTLKFVRRYSKVYLLITAGALFNIMLAYAITGWIPTLFVRTYHWEASKIGAIFGIIYMVFGSVGTFSGGVLGDRLARKGYLDAYIRTMLILIPGSMVIAALPLAPSPEIALFLLAIGLLCLSTGVALPIAALTQVTPNEFRGQVLAMYFFVLYILGVGVGPVAVALLTDYIFVDTLLLQYSIAVVASIAVPCNIVTLWLCLRPYAKMVQGIQH